MVYSIYYAKEPDFRDFRGENCNVDPDNLLKTHTPVRVIKAESLDEVFHECQGDFWSPNGEARDLIEALGLQHTSMSVGDVIKDEEGKIFFVASVGFKQLN